MTQPFKSGCQNIGSSASDFPMDIQGWFPLELTGLISLLPKGLLSSPAPQLESINFWHAAFFMVQLSHLYMTTRNIIVLTIWTFISIVTSLLFNMLSRFVIAFLPRRKSFLILWLQSPSTDFGAQENKVCHYFHFFPFYLPWSDVTGYISDTLLKMSPSHILFQTTGLYLGDKLNKKRTIIFMEVKKGKQTHKTGRACLPTYLS